MFFTCTMEGKWTFIFVINSCFTEHNVVGLDLSYLEELGLGALLRGSSVAVMREGPFAFPIQIYPDGPGGRTDDLNSP